MRRLFFLVLALGLIYSAFWFGMSTFVERGATSAIEQARERGWQIVYSDLSTAGFPSRLDTTVSDLSLATPDGRVRWTAPFVQLLALTYRPNHVIALWPPDQQVMVDGQTVEVASDQLRASVAVGFSSLVPLRTVTLESDALTLSSAGWTLRLGHLLAALREAAAGPGTYDLWFEGTGLSSPAIPAGLDLFRLDAQVRLDAPLDRRLQAPPRLLSLALHEARVASGPAALSVSGDLAPDAQGYLAGSVRLVAENWRQILDRLTSAGLLPADRRGFIERAIDGLAQGKDQVALPLDFENGRVELLGLDILEAPRVL